MSNFVNACKAIANETYTENGAVAYRSTGGGALLDFYAKIGGMRNRDANDIREGWRLARKENEEFADNLILYARDIRNAGLGERRIGRILLKELVRLNPEKVKRNFDTLVNVGRYDDLFELLDTSIGDDVINFVIAQLMKDIEGVAANAPISLLAKWMPSINTSSKETCARAHRICKVAGIKPRTYRKTLSKLRSYLNVVEVDMSANQWGRIDYEAVPSIAARRYSKAFSNRDAERYGDYMAALEKGEAKVNASVLYPYDIVENILYHKDKTNHILDAAQWNELPNYVSGEYDVVVMADVSGSMWGKPMATSIGLAVYFAQRNKGAYHGLYMTYSRNPEFLEIKDNWDIHRCVNETASRGIGYNTDLDKAFARIYDIAARTREVPKALVVISDGQFDWDCGREDGESIIGKWNRKLRDIGLPETKVISWNVNGRQDNYMAMTTDNISYCSGAGVGPFKFLTELIEKSAYEAMVEILSRPEFSWK